MTTEWAQKNESLFCLGHHVIILGDFNAPDICWSTLCGSTSPSNALCDFIVANGLDQHVSFPTHNCGHILDLVLSSSPDIVQNLCCLSSPLLSSDHFPITFDLLPPLKQSQKSPPAWSHAFKRTNFDGLNSFLLDYDFGPLYDSTDIEFSWSFLRGVILTAISMFTPMVKVRTNKLPQWFTPSIRHQLNKVHSLRKRYKHHPSPQTFHRLIHAECLLQLNICDARAAFEKKLVHNFVLHKDSGIFKYLRSLSGQSSLPSVMSLNSTVADTPSSVADLFNKYFHSVYVTSSSSVSFPPASFPDKSLCSIDISLQDTFEALCSLKCDKAMGGDGIPPAILKGAATALLDPIHHLFQLCVSQSSIPTQWRDHYITPIPKSDASVSNCQYGFIRNRSTIKQLLLHTKNIINALEDHQQLDTVLLDIRKAFDTVPHHILLTKLWQAGITGSLWQL
uniref:Endonuclease/exonuclease/phosphatase domain-containing protein n=1 Tax=Amphimedon queenslandica TaxID=400682 RepID=A0A1X7SPP3_AMPQE